MMPTIVYDPSQIDFEKPGKHHCQVAFHLDARLFDTPVVMVYSSQMASGLLTDEAEALGKITLGGEFGFAESTHRQGTLHAYEGIKNVLRNYGLLRGEIVKIDRTRLTPPRFVQAVNLEDYIPCPRNGIWEPTIDIGS